MGRLLVVGAIPAAAGGEVIVRAAILRDGGVYSVPRPGRHHHVLALMRQNGLSQLWSREIQGFLTDTVEFLGRFAAAEVGYLNCPPNLYSEDLW